MGEEQQKAVEVAPKRNGMFMKDGEPHSPYSPASTNEDPAFRRVANRGMYASLAGYFLLAYGLSFAMISDPDLGRRLSGWVVSAAENIGISAVRVRFDDLTALDGVSGFAYVASILVGVGLGLLLAAWFIVHYTRLVLLPGRFVRIDRRAWRGWLSVFGFTVFVTWVAYFANLGLAGNPYPGMGSFFVWPVSPAYGYGAAFSMAGLAFATIAAIQKIVFQLKE